MRTNQNQCSRVGFFNTKLSLPSVENSSSKKASETALGFVLLCHSLVCPEASALAPPALLFRALHGDNKKVVPGLRQGLQIIPLKYFFNFSSNHSTESQETVLPLSQPSRLCTSLTLVLALFLLQRLLKLWLLLTWLQEIFHLTPPLTEWAREGLWLTTLFSSPSLHILTISEFKTQSFQLQQGREGGFLEHLISKVKWFSLWRQAFFVLWDSFCLGEMAYTMRLKEEKHYQTPQWGKKSPGHLLSQATCSL